jgi:hypothetical protein
VEAAADGAPAFSCSFKVCSQSPVS